MVTTLRCAVAMLLLSGPALAQAPAAPPAPALPPGQLDCKPLIGVPLPKIPEFISGNGILRGTILLSDRQQRIAFRTPPGNVPGQAGNSYECFPQYVRYFTGIGTTPPTPPPAPNDYANPMPGPTLRARVGDVVQLTLLNQVNASNFGSSIDRAENGIGNGCDTSSGGNVADSKNPGQTVPQAGYPQNTGDTFPDCFHGSSTGNLHFHGTHTNPNATGDNVLLELRPSPRVNGKPTITEATFKSQFNAFFEACAKQLKANVLNEWPSSWNDQPLGPPQNPRSYVGMQKSLLEAYDKGRPKAQQLWPVNLMQYEEGAWPQYYIGAYPYCFVLPEYKSSAWPPTSAAQASSSHVHTASMAPAAPTGRALQMGQSPGTHWYHAHKHGSTAINVANGMTGAFIIEGKYDADLNAFYGAGWTRKQPTMVINQIGVSPNLLRLSPARTDKGPDFSVNGRLQPRIKMYPGEVQLWRIVNSSGRAGAFFVGPPQSNPGSGALNPTTDFQWRQIAQDGVQFADSTYQRKANQSFLLASGNRADILVKAPTQPGIKSFDVLVQNTVASTDLLTANKVPLISVDIDGTGPEMQFIPKAPEQPAYLADITDAEIKATKTVTFTTGQIGAPGQQTINGQPFSGQVGEVMLLNTAEEWKVQNASVKVSVDHPFHIHINPFQITEVFDPNEKIDDPASTTTPKAQIDKYIFSDAPLAAGQCRLDANDPQSWKPCTRDAAAKDLIWWDVFPIPYGRTVSAFGRNIVVPGHFKMRSRFTDYPGLFVIHCHILAHEDRGMMMVVEVRPAKMPYAHH